MKFYLSNFLKNCEKMGRSFSSTFFWGCGEWYQYGPGIWLDFFTESLQHIVFFLDPDPQINFLESAPFFCGYVGYVSLFFFLGPPPFFLNFETIFTSHQFPCHPAIGDPFGSDGTARVDDLDLKS